MIIIKKIQKSFILLAVILGIGTAINAQESLQEEDFFRILRVSSPEGTLLEVGGMVVLPNGDLGISTRRGDIFIVENPTSANPYFRKFASGLHEVLGLAYKDGALYCAQRGELTKLVDTNGDGLADVFETIYAWPLSGNYHEYSFGPTIAPDGSFFVTTNLGFPNPWWHAKSLVPWRGWTLKISPEGKMEPWATGMRSPAGMGMMDGEFFYSENQGDWVGSGGIWHVKKGAFTVHPGGLKWAGRPESPVKLTQEQVFAKMDQRLEVDESGQHVKPENRVNDELITLADMKDEFPGLQLPAVWLPHGIYGISNSEIVKIPRGHFGPFEGQLLVGDQGQSKIMRVFLEEVAGEFQGIAWDFRSGFQSGVLRMAWANDGSLFVGETNRGWGSAGDANEGLQRLIWNKRIPFEMRAVRAMVDGFEIEFTSPVDRKSAEDLASYSVESFIYKYHAVYGSPPVNRKTVAVNGVKVSEDGLKARIILDTLTKHYIHKITLDGVRARDNYYSLVHPTGYYTLNNIPDGEKLSLDEVSTLNSTAVANEKQEKQAKSNKRNPVSQSGKKDASNQKVVTKKAPDFEEIKPLLINNTCSACHNPEKKQVGPSYKEIAKRNYTNQQILELIHNPKPQNWPEYATPMPPMPQVSVEDALKIADYINSLN